MSDQPTKQTTKSLPGFAGLSPAVMLPIFGLSWVAVLITGRPDWIFFLVPPLVLVTHLGRMLLQNLGTGRSR